LGKKHPQGKENKKLRQSHERSAKCGEERVETRKLVREENENRTAQKAKGGERKRERER
jgi:hypothetical protein